MIGRGTRDPSNVTLTLGVEEVSIDAAFVSLFVPALGFSTLTDNAWQLLLVLQGVLVCLQALWVVEGELPQTSSNSKFVSAIQQLL